MTTNVGFLSWAKSQLSEQERRIQIQQEVVKSLAATGSSNNERRADELLWQMQQVAFRLRHEVDALEAHEVIRKRLQANRVHA